MATPPIARMRSFTLLRETLGVNRAAIRALSYRRWRPGVAAIGTS